jgi:hypothetical protein
MIVRKDVPCVMKLAHYLSFYERRHGTRLSPELADQEAAKEGFALDHGGETRRSGNSRPDNSCRLRKPEDARREKETHATAYEEEVRPIEAANHIAAARHLLTELRKKLRGVEDYPELREAITKLEMALSILTVKTGGML